MAIKGGPEKCLKVDNRRVARNGGGVGNLFPVAYL